MTDPAPDLRDRLAEALLARLKRTIPPIAPGGMGLGATEFDLADVVLGVVQAELDQWAADCQRYTDLATGAERTRQIHKHDADQYEEQLRGERDRYRSAWLSARQRAGAYGEGILRHCEDRDTWKGWKQQQEARAIVAEEQLSLCRQGAVEHRAQLEEARDLLSNAGHNRAHGDDWPDTIPALQELIAERDQLRAQVAAVRTVHQRVDCANARCDTGGWCIGCDPEGGDFCSVNPWPCPTITALDGQRMTS